MSYSGLYTLGFDIDSNDKIWVVGQDLRMFNGATWTYYNYQNSAVPSAAPYYLDTRTISISPDGTKWVGCAEIASLDDTAIFYIAPDDINIGKSWSFNDIDTFDTPIEVSKIYACPYGNDVLAFLTLGGSGSAGLTGGFLYRYDIPNDSWKRVADGYTWPYIYDIKARGFGGDDYRYYLGTSQGIIEIPGEELGVSYLEGNIPYIPSASFYNSSNFSNLSDNIYSLGFDEVRI